MNVAFFLLPKIKVAYLYEDNTLRQGLEKMRHHGYTAIPVITREGEYAGCVSEGDFLWNILGMGNGDLHEMELVRISSIMTTKRAEPVRITTDIEDLMDKAAGQNFVPVVDDRNMFMGIVTRQSVINALREKARANGEE